MAKRTARKGHATSKRTPEQPQRRAARTSLSPARLLQLGMGFWGSRALLSALELDLFSVLAKGPLDEDQLRVRLALHPRSARDFFDSLVALGLLQRTAGRYRNTPDSEAFLDRAKPGYIGCLYPFWASGMLEKAAASLTEALRTGSPQDEAKGGGPFATLYADPGRLRTFLSAMTRVSMGSARAIAAMFPWKIYQTFVDVGGAQGCVPVQVALAHKHLQGAAFDLPQVGPIYEDYVRSFGLEARLKFHAGDFFRDPLPQADVLIMGHVLHDWDLQQKHLLLQKAYAALPKHGALLVYDAMIDNARRRNVMGLLMSLNMLIETPGGFDYTPADCRGWMKATGFRKISVMPLTATESMVIAMKQRRRGQSRCLDPQAPASSGIRN